MWLLYMSSNFLFGFLNPYSSISMMSTPGMLGISIIQYGCWVLVFGACSYHDNGLMIA